MRRPSASLSDAAGSTSKRLGLGHLCYDQWYHDALDSEKPIVLVPQLEALSRMRIEPDKTLLVLDEVQMCPRALTSLKYFCDQAPKYHVAFSAGLIKLPIKRTIRAGIRYHVGFAADHKARGVWPVTSSHDLLWAKVLCVI